jgi:hypothetical protein
MNLKSKILVIIVAGGSIWQKYSDEKGKKEKKTLLHWVYREG